MSTPAPEAFSPEEDEEFSYFLNECVLGARREARARVDWIGSIARLPRLIGGLQESMNQLGASMNRFVSKINKMQNPTD